MVTRLGLYGGPRGLYGSFAGKTPSASQISGSTGFTWTPSGDLNATGALSGSTGFSWTPSGNLSATIPISGSTGFTWTPTGNLVDANAVIETAPSGGFMVRGVFDSLADRKRRKLKKLKEDIEEIEELPAVDREIAQLLHQDDENELIESSLKELENLVKSNITASQIEQEFSERVAKAFTRAAIQGNFSALEALEREMDRAREEEDFLMLAMIVVN